MKRRLSVYSLLLLGLTLNPLSVPATVAGDEPSPPFCNRTARNSFWACNLDANDDFWEARAACINLAGEPERVQCRADTVAARNEARDECQAQREAREALCDTLGGDRYLPDFDPANFQDPDDITVPNPYLDLTPGSTRVLTDPDAGEVVVILVTDETKQIDGVSCRIVVDVAIEVGEDEEEGGVEYIPLEVTDDWFAPHVSGDTWYCGELSRNFEDGELADLDGSFTAGVDGALPGLLIPANPVIGQLYRQEFAVNEAEDVAEVISVNAGPAEEVAGFECNGACLQTEDSSPLEPDVTEDKFYLAGTGFVLAIGFEDGVEDGREELVCAGPSLDILADPACGIEDVAELMDELCDLSDFFCPEDDPLP